MKFPSNPLMINTKGKWFFVAGHEVTSNVSYLWVYCKECEKEQKFKEDEVPEHCPVCIAAASAAGDKKKL